MSGRDFASDTLEEEQHTRIKPPPLFKVLLLNDDFTPMDFVVAVLERFFLKAVRRQSIS